MKIIITGGCGFVGHHAVEHFMKKTDWEIIILDKLTYASRGLDRVRDISADVEKRVTFFAVDFTRPLSVGLVKELSDVDYILHMGAETHVDNSIKDPGSFVYSNVVGTFNMLEFARQCPSLKAFCYFSTDEVYGPAPKGTDFKEWDRYNCTNPYSATKAGGEQLCMAFFNTYKLRGFVVNCMNIFGERQHPEKFIPLCIRKIKDGETIYIHGTPDKKQSGSRFYIHARNVANAVHWLLSRFEQRERYNIVGEKELTNLEVAQKIASIMGKELKYEITDYHSSRPGHDLRYSLDGNKLKSMGYILPMTIDETLKTVTQWTLDNQKWLYLKKEEQK